MKTTTQGVILKPKTKSWYGKAEGGGYVLFIDGEPSEYKFSTWKDAVKDQKARAESYKQIKAHNRKLTDSNRKS